MTKHHRTAHIDRFRFGHQERPISVSIPTKAVRALWNRLPMIGAEALLLASFLHWLAKNDSGHHGLALVFAWTVYGLIALSILLLWIEPAEEDTDRRP